MFWLSDDLACALSSRAARRDSVLVSGDFDEFDPSRRGDIERDSRWRMLLS